MFYEKLWKQWKIKKIYENLGKTNNNYEKLSELGHFS